MLKNLSDNLNLLMANERLNSSELARLTGVPATTIKRIRNNEQSNPTILTLLPLANYFSLTISQLLDCEFIHLNSLITKQCHHNKLHTIPLLSWHECVHFESLDYLKRDKLILTEKNVSTKSFALVVDECDLAIFPEKSTLIIEPNCQPKSGDYVIVAKSDQGRASIKKYIIDTDQIYLKSVISGLGITPITDNYRILGTIIRYYVDLKFDH